MALTCAGTELQSRLLRIGEEASRENPLDPEIMFCFEVIPTLDGVTGEVAIFTLVLDSTDGSVSLGRQSMAIARVSRVQGIRGEYFAYIML